MITKEQAYRCITHHWACDCREYKMQQMEHALKQIAFLCDEAQERYAYNEIEYFLISIRDLAKEALD